MFRRTLVDILSAFLMETPGGGSGPAAPPAPPAPPAPQPPATPAPTPPAPDPAGETVTLPADEVNRLREAAARGAQQTRAAQRAAEEAEAERQRQAGQFETLYEGERGKVTKITGVVADSVRRSVVSETAQRLGFANPALAHRLINARDIAVSIDLDADELDLSALDGAVDTAGRTLIEQRLNAILDENPNLRGQPAPRQLPGAGANPAAPGAGEAAGNAGMNHAIRRAAGRA